MARSPCQTWKRSPRGRVVAQDPVGAGAQGSRLGQVRSPKHRESWKGLGPRSPIQFCRPQHHPDRGAGSGEPPPQVPVAFGRPALSKSPAPREKEHFRPILSEGHLQQGDLHLLGHQGPTRQPRGLVPVVGRFRVHLPNRQSRLSQRRSHLCVADHHRSKGSPQRLQERLPRRLTGPETQQDRVVDPGHWPTHLAPPCRHRPRDQGPTRTRGAEVLQQRQGQHKVAQGPVSDQQPGARLGQSISSPSSCSPPRSLAPSRVILPTQMKPPDSLTP